MSKFNKRIISVFAQMDLAPRPFLIAAVAYDHSGVETARFIGRRYDLNMNVKALSSEGKRQLDEMLAVPAKYVRYTELLAAFVEFYTAIGAEDADDSDVVAYFASGEDRVFDDMLRLEFVAKRPMVCDVLNVMSEVGDRDNLDDYIKKHNLRAGDFTDTEVPLRKADAVAVVYRHLMRRLAGERV